MKAVIIEDETTAVNSLKAILAQNTVTPIEVIAELESIEESVEFFRTSPHPDIIFIIRKSKCSRVSKRKVHFTKRSV